MGKALRFMLIIFFLCRMQSLFSQTPSVVISSYYNAADPRDEWSELLVVTDNTNMVNWIYQDNNAAQSNWQPAIIFNNPLFWKNMRAGTIIMIWHRQVGSTGISHPLDVNKTDGYIEVSANDTTYFSGGNFGTAPLFNGPTLNIAAAGDLLILQDATPALVHALGHKAVVGPSWGFLPPPKLNYQSAITDGEAVYVCPGASLDEYGTLPPQDGTTWAAGGTGASLTFGLPNTCTTSTTANSDFWRSLRQPGWINPVLTGTVNPANNEATLNWNTADDPFPVDGTQGYMLLRNTSNVFGTPLDGHTYAVGENLGGATVIALIDSSQILSYTDTVAVPCPGGFYYRIFAFRYTTDNTNGNDYNVARGRAYNEIVFASVQVNGLPPVAPVTATSDRNNICIGDTGNITLSVTGGSGTTLNWFTVSCGGTLLGAGSGTNGSITIPSPAVTTTYYARWESTCGVSTCASVTVNVLNDLPVGVSITASANPVCPGTSVTYTASPVNPGTAPVYQWKVNGVNVGPDSNIYTYTPSNGDSISVVMTSNDACPSGNPATSNIIGMLVSSGVPVSVNIIANPSDTICPGTTVIYTATPVNGGTNPSYQWFLNGTPVGFNNATWSNVPANGDAIYCKVTSDVSCAVNNPATSNTLVIVVSSWMPVNVVITAVPGDTICSGSAVTFTATPVNGGATPIYQWFLNGNPVGSNSPVYLVTPADGDAVYCTVNSSLSCAITNPATSNTLTITYTPALDASVTITSNHSAICPGSVVTFTAFPLNEGTSPLYEWLVNGVSVQLGSSPVYITGSLTGGESILCRLTSSLPCLVANPVESPSLTLPAAPAPVVKLTNKPFLCAGEPSQLDAGPGFSAYLWQDGSTGRYYMAINQGVYRVTVTDSLGCTASDSVLMKACDELMFVPDAFTPNGDGLNDEFKVITPLEEITGFSMQVYNRWGEMVFESSDIHHGWNGMVNGKYAPPDTYVWKIIYQVPSQGTSSPSSTTLHGTVMLIR
jgi:gliding motility-associated-like protein